MDMPWWGWFLIALYCTPGVRCFVVLTTLPPTRALPEEGEEPFRPLPWRLRAPLLAALFVAVLILWPVVVWTERPR